MVISKPDYTGYKASHKGFVEWLNAIVSQNTVLFLGWFGPRGLASIVLGLIVVEEVPLLAGLERIQVVVAITVLLSIFAHGISTNPLIDLYARRTKAFDTDAGEHQEAHVAPTRKVA